MRTTMITLIIITMMVGSITVLGGIGVLSKFQKQNAMLNEYEFLLADLYSENQYLKDRLGVFYMPRKGKGG